MISYEGVGLPAKSSISFPSNISPACTVLCLLALEPFQGSLAKLYLGPASSSLFPSQDTLRECTREDKHCLSYLPVISPVYFVTFVLIAQFVLVNVVVAVLMKHLEESNKEAKEDAEMDAEIELEMSRGAATPASSGGGGSTAASDGRAPYGSQEGGKLESPLRVKQQALVMMQKGLFLLSPVGNRSF